MNSGYLSLSIAALLPAAVSLIIFFLEKRTKFGQLSKNSRQIIIGVIFGFIAIVGTEWGIPIHGAQVNCRDAAVLAAGLIFGGPAGIIAGVIGGVERWFAVYWGIGSFTRIACSVSTILAGIYAAAMRRFMFENKKPGWLLSAAIGVVMEVFHLTMVFATNTANPDLAIKVVKACSAPMIIANGLSVMAAAVAISIAAKDFRSEKIKNVRIAQTIQRWLLLTVFAAFIISTAFLYQLETGISNRQMETQFQKTISEINDDIDDSFIGVTQDVAGEIGTASLSEIAEKYDVAEINIVNEEGIITQSTNQEFIGFDMKSSEQSKAFMCLAESEKSYVQEFTNIGFDESVQRKYAGVATSDGFVQVGYDAEHLKTSIHKRIAEVTQNRHIGEKGFIVILDNDLNLVSSSDEAFVLSSGSLSSLDRKSMEPGVTYRIDLDGKDLYYQYNKSADGFITVGVMPVEEAMNIRNVAMLVNTYMEILIFAVLFIFVYLIIKKVVVNKIKQINCSLAKITGGNLDETIDVRSNEEFASLSDDINSTVDTLKQYIDEASARIDKELEFAKNIQKSALPTIFPAFPNKTEFDIYASMTPAREVGGDFYDYYFVGENTLAFLIADVSGKGIPAAMFMMTAKTLIKNLAETGIAVEEVFTRANEELCKMNETGMFVTAWLGEIDLKTGILSFANAGHNPPLVKRGKGKYEYLKARSGLVLAGMEGIKYRRNEIQLMPGDRIYLYTDGVTEAANSETQLYGEDRLIKAINDIDTAQCESTCIAIKKSVDDFVGEAEQFDDITMLSFNLKELDGYNSLTVIPSAQSIARVTEFVESWMAKTKVDKKIISKVNIAIDEIYSNIAYYSGAQWAKVHYTRDLEAIYLTFTDDGKPYNPLENEDPDITLSAEEREIGGLGIFMVRKIMDSVEYKYENSQNVLKLTKKL